LPPPSAVPDCAFTLVKADRQARNSYESNFLPFPF
jgi:hypothetical protein